MLRFVLASTLVLAFAGCESTYWYTGPAEVTVEAAPDPEPVVEHPAFEYRPDSRDIQQATNIPLRPDTVHKRVSDYAAQLAMSLISKAYTLNKSDKVAVASFVVFDKTLNQPTVLGNRLAEALISELQTLGVTVIDTKLAKSLSITAYGDIAFSRDVSKLAKELHVDYIVSGTLIERARGVEVNARVIGVAQQNIAAASTLFIPRFIALNEVSYPLSD